MSVSLVSYLLDEAGHASLTIMKSSTIYLGFEIIGRVAESYIHRGTGVWLRPAKTGFGGFAFKLIRPFSSITPNQIYKFPTSLLAISTVAMGALTYLTGHFIVPRQISCICPTS